MIRGDDMSDIEIRDASDSDLARMREIYNEVLARSTAIFSDIARSAEDHSRWYADRRSQGWPVIVACRGASVLGYATYGSFRTWPGYRHTVENSVYVSASARGQGVGTRLLSVLIERAKTQGLHAMIAGIDGDNTVSMELHAKAGFTKVGHLRQVGRKFDRWLDLAFYECLLSD